VPSSLGNGSPVPADVSRSATRTRRVTDGEIELLLADGHASFSTCRTSLPTRSAGPPPL
jgi:hypothetical protein